MSEVETATVALPSQFDNPNGVKGTLMFRRCGRVVSCDFLSYLVAPVGNIPLGTAPERFRPIETRFFPVATSTTVATSPGIVVDGGGNIQFRNPVKQSAPFYYYGGSSWLAR